MDKPLRLWKYRVKPEKIAVSNFIAVSSKNTLFCFDRNGLRWKWRAMVTFYRDPYGDVKITAIDANSGFIAAGTNFMDGKLYLFSFSGELLWENQFATTASLGWRPEDVTAVKVGKNLVAAGTEFMNEYIYVYTIKRKRIFQKKVDGRVTDLILDKNIVVGTEKRLYVMNEKGETISLLDFPVEKLMSFRQNVLAYGNETLIALSDGEVRWRKRVKASNICAADDEIFITHGDLLRCLSEDGEVLWEKEFGSEILAIHYDDELHVGIDGKVCIYDGGWRSMDVKGKPLKFGNGLLLVYDGYLHLYEIS